MTLERIVLKTIKFDLQVDHPYKFILKYAKTFIGDKSKIEKIVQMSWTFANDRYVLNARTFLPYVPQCKAYSYTYFYREKIFTRNQTLLFH